MRSVFKTYSPGLGSSSQTKVKDTLTQTVGASNKYSLQLHTDKPASTCPASIYYFALLEWQLQLTDFYQTVIFFFLKKMFLRKLNYLGPKYAHAVYTYLLRKLAGAIRIGSSVSAPGAKLIPLLKPCGKQDHASVPVGLTLAWLKLIYLFTSARFAHTLRCQIS